jgi:tetratricopeptide (TPR) repeat protein
MRRYAEHSQQGKPRAPLFKRCAGLGVPLVLVCVLALPESRARAEGLDLPGAEKKDAVEMAAAQALLLHGVRAFRAERYDEALRIFRQVEAEDPPRDIGFYLGMALHKLGRHLDALVAFRAAHRAGLYEPVADYYQAVSCYRLGMLERARQGFSGLIAPRASDALPSGLSDAPTPILGPRLSQGAQRFLQAIDQSISQASAEAEPTSQRQALLGRRYEAAIGAARSLPDEAALEWLDEAARLLPQLAERGDKLPNLRQQLVRLRDALHGKPAEADVLSLLTLLGAG